MIKEQLAGGNTRPNSCRVTEAMEGLYELGKIHLNKGKSLHIVHLDQLDGHKLAKHICLIDGTTKPANKFSRSRFDWCLYQNGESSFVSLNKDGKKTSQITITKEDPEAKWHYGYHLRNKNNGLAVAYIFGDTPVNNKSYKLFNSANPEDLLKQEKNPINLLRCSLLHTGLNFTTNPLLVPLKNFKLQTQNKEKSETPQAPAKSQIDAKLQFFGLKTYGKFLGFHIYDKHIDNNQQAAKALSGILHESPSSSKLRQASQESTTHKLKHGKCRPIENVTQLPKRATQIRD